MTKDMEIDLFQVELVKIACFKRLAIINLILEQLQAQLKSDDWETISKASTAVCVLKDFFENDFEKKKSQLEFIQN